MVKLLLLVGVGSAIGWITNKLALWMLFNPKKPLYFKWFYGVIPARKKELAESVGEEVKSLLDKEKEIKEKVTSLKADNLSELFSRLPWRDILISTGAKSLEVDKYIAKTLEEMDLEELEQRVQRILKREFRFIEFLGALLGGLIGFIQWLFI